MFICSFTLFVAALSAPLCFLTAAAPPEPYCSLKTVFPFDGDGWFANGEHLQECFAKNRIKTVIEVGSWLGLSTRFLGSKVGSGGKVYAVDTWLGTPEEEVHQKDPRLPHLYEMFLSNVIHEGLTDVIIPIRMDSLEAAKSLNIKADLIYIDASHLTEAVYQDILHWYPHLNEGGIFCGDDFCWWTVQEGVRKAAAELDLQIESGYTWWRLY
jgi:hypothetical protein